MLSQATLRKVWGTRCTGRKARYALHGSGIVHVHPAIVPAVAGLNLALIHHDYKTRAKDTGAYNCRRIGSSSSWSLHSWGIALDLNWTTNPHSAPLRTDMPRAMIRDIEAIRTNNGRQVWRWGGTFNTPDAMHFEVVAGPADLATGINVATLPRAAADPTPPAKPQTLPNDDPTTEDDMVKYLRAAENGAILSITTEHYRHMGPKGWAERVKWGATVTTLPAKDIMAYIAAHRLIELPATD